MVTVGMDLATSARAVDIAEARDDVVAAVGLHPWNAQDHPDGPPVEGLKELARSGSVVALGEIGLDFVENKWLQALLRRPGAPAHPAGGVPVASSSSRRSSGCR